MIHFASSLPIVLAALVVATTLNCRHTSTSAESIREEMPVEPGSDSYVQAPHDTVVVAPSGNDRNADFRLGADPGLATLFNDQFFTTSSVVELMPDAPQFTFRSGQRVYVFAALKSPKDQSVHISWFDPDGNRVLPTSYHDVEMNMAPPGYRLYTFRSFRKPGPYRVAIYNSVDEELGSVNFEIRSGQ